MVCKAVDRVGPKTLRNLMADRIPIKPKGTRVAMKDEQRWEPVIETFASVADNSASAIVASMKNIKVNAMLILFESCEWCVTRSCPQATEHLARYSVVEIVANAAPPRKGARGCPKKVRVS
jgi:hypothetical protein